MGILGFLAYWAFLILLVEVLGIDWWEPKLWEVAAAGLMAGLVGGLIAHPRPRSGFVVGLIGGLSAGLAWNMFAVFMIGVFGNPQPIPPIVMTSSMLLLVLSSAGSALGAIVRAVLIGRTN